MTAEEQLKQDRAAIFLREHRSQADAMLNGERGLAPWNYSGVAHKPVQNPVTTDSDNGSNGKA
jgi:hypothetical protein